jgi:vacuolar iron transporter family protein
VDFTPIYAAHVTEAEKIGSAEIGHTHSDVSGGWLRPAVFGAMDGLVTNIALVAGVGGAGETGHVIVLSGMAGLVAGAFSMALGEYTSVGTQNKAVEREAAVERAELERNPEAEQAELVEMYREMGLSQQTAELVAEEIHANPELAIRVHLTQELGVDPDEQPSPVVAAISSFLCFAVGAVFPLLPFLFGLQSLWLGLGIGGIGLFTAGAIVARFTRMSWWINGLRQLLFGAIAAGATYGIGTLIGVNAG